MSRLPHWSILKARQTVELTACIMMTAIGKSFGHIIPDITYNLLPRIMCGRLSFGKRRDVRNERQGENL